MSQELNGFYTNIKELTKDISMGRPHVFILGAGVSKAAFPKGNRNGKGLSLMDDFVETTVLNSTLVEQGLSYVGRNFKEIYSDLYEDSSYGY